MAMDDRIRTSDADREHITARLRDHFAEGRLTREELDDRVTAALNAKTFGDLRGLMADLPEPALVPPQGRSPRAGRYGPGPLRVRRGPRLLPLAFLLLLGAVLLPGGGWVFLAFFQVLLVFALVACAAAIFAVARFRRRMHQHWAHGHHEFWAGPGWGGPGSRGWPGGPRQHHYHARYWADPASPPP